LFGSLRASWASGEPGPNTFGTSTATFSRTMLADPITPTSHPARVKGTQGAGAFRPSGVTMFGEGSGGVGLVGSKMPSVQYANETPTELVPSGL
jgi:hypothetical protein